MPNMSYCRWENTSNDLNDCLEALNEYVENAELPTKKRSHGIPSISEFRETLGSNYEKAGFDRLIDLARELVALVDEFDM